MKKAGLLSVLLTLCILPVSVWACDVCGCSSAMGAGSLGLNNRMNLISLRSQYAGFHSIDHLGLTAYDQYMQADLFGQISFFQKFQLQVDIPFGVRLRDYQENSWGIQGLGDPWARVDFYPISIQTNENRKSSHELSLGVGIKAPLGQFNPESSHNGLTPLPANFQLGTGSWDNFFNMSYKWQLDKWGVQFQANSRINRQNQLLYKFGNQTSSQLIGFRWFERKQHVFRFFGGGYAEWIQADEKFAMELIGTGGKGYYASMGAEYVRDNFAINFQATQPISQRYSSGMVTAKSRLGFSISYFI